MAFPTVGQGAESFVKAMVLQARADAMTEWRQDMDTRRDYYDGNQKPALTAAMATVDFPKTHRHIRKVTWGFTKKVIDTTSRVYWQPPARELSNDDGETVDAGDPSAAQWTELQKDGGLDNVLRMVNRWTRLYVSNAVWTQYDATLDRLKWVSVAPQDIYVIQSPDAPGDIARAELVIIPMDGRNETVDASGVNPQKWVALSQTEAVPFFGSVNDSGSFDVAEWGEPGPQLAGRIPLTMFFDRYPEGQILPEGNSEVIDANLIINLTLSNLYHLQKMQSFGQPVLRSAFDYPANMIAGPEQILQIRDADGQFTYESPNAQLSDVRDIVEYLMKSAATLNNLSPGTFSTEVNQLSGIAKKIEELPLIQFTAEQQSLYAAYETDLFEVSRAVWNNHARHDPISEELKQVVTFVPLDFPSDPGAELDALERRIALGITARWEAIKDEHPEFTEEQARDRLAENLKETNAKARADKPAEFSFDFTDTDTQAPATKSADGPVSAPDSESEGEVAAAPSETLNGAQILALVDVLKSVTDGTLPKETAREVIAASFPISEQRITAMLAAIEEGDPADIAARKQAAMPPQFKAKPDEEPDA
jgi:hypothetical protein